MTQTVQVKCGAMRIASKCFEGMEQHSAAPERVERDGGAILRLFSLIERTFACTPTDSQCFIRAASRMVRFGFVSYHSSILIGRVSHFT